ESERLADVAPVAAARAAFRRAVEDDEPVTDLVRGAPHGQVQRVFAESGKQLAGPPPQVEVVQLEGRGGAADDRGRRAVGPLARRGDLPVELPGGRAGVRRRDSRLERSFEPVVAQVAGRLI